MNKGLEQCDKCDYFISVEEAHNDGYNQALDDCRKLCGVEKANYGDCGGCAFAHFENDFFTTICKLEQLKK